MPTPRYQVIAKMREAFRGGISVSKFLADMKAQGLSYRRTDMLSDWRTVNEIEKKGGALRFVRKDYYPAKAAMAEIEWALSKEYMYKVKTESRLRPDAPITTRFVNIMSDTPMTPSMLESEVESQWGEWERYGAEELTGLQVWSAVHRVMA